LAFIGFLSSEALSGLSLMYCVKFLDRLREKFGFFTEGNEENEDFRSGGGQSLCFLCYLLFRIFACAASTNTAGSASTPAFAQLRRGRQRGGYNIL
jgi:hypothetical protein